MTKYQTKQRAGLLAFLSGHPNEQFSIDIVSQAVRNVSKSAIYRNINRMVEDGIIRRFQIEGSRTFLYQYVGTPECNRHLHLKCSRCGVILHTDILFSEQLMDFVESRTSFTLDLKKTMLFGACSHCRELGMLTL